MTLKNALGNPSPRILFIDIETAPALIAAFPPLHETNAVWTERGTYILGFSAMWEGQKKPKSYFLPKYPAFKKDIHNDRAVCAELHRYLSLATHVVAHNGDSFDLKVINTRLLINGFPPPLGPRGSTDTLKASRRIFKFDSNRLDACGQATGVGRKLDTPKGLHRDCYHGSLKAFRTMARYCRQDTWLLHEYHEEIRPWLNIKFSGKLGKQHGTARTERWRRRP